MQLKQANWMKLLYWLILLTSLSANARVFSEDFTSLTYKDSSTLIWNFELGFLHTELQIYNYYRLGQAVASQTTFSAGDGSLGAFELSTYSQFGTVVGSHITIDASQIPILKVTRFQLDSGYTLSSINGPLVIYSLSTVNINGVIECFGNDGGNAVGATGGAGGTGRCGGISGGAGGSAVTSGTNGLPLTGNVTGGGGAIYTGAVPGAGGGGGASYYGLDGDVGENSTPAANAGGNPGSGTNNIDYGFINLNGSAGGGGGSGSSTEGGSGGGAGGGTVVIHAVSGVTIANGGAILAYGGSGGAANDGGGGGGGGGGSVKIFTPAHLEVAALGTIDASSGPGATPTNVSAGTGGAGALGRAWLVARTSNYAGPVNGSTLLANEGTVGFVSGTVQTATSKSFDTGSKRVTYQSFIANPVSSGITLEVAGSDDDFVSDNSGWINTAAISGIATKRYIKFRVNLNNPDALNPTFVNDVTLTYDPGQIDDFTFKSGGCGLVQNTPPPNSSLWFRLLLLFVPLILAWRLRKPKTVRVRVRK